MRERKTLTGINSITVKKRRNQNKCPLYPIYINITSKIQFIEMKRSMHTN